jgi:DHA2 family metal-tetracycline-proton antiporter-like MFS transporter/DHA2 family florfenicol/chloramphenicol resistance protein-like MFS transporter
MLFFLGGGFGPALLGAFLAFRREGGAVAAINPAYALDVPAFSDAFLAMGLALLVTLVVTLPKFPSSTKRALL